MSNSGKKMEPKKETAKSSNAQYNTENDDKEQTGIRLMREILEKKDPSSKEVDDQMTRRFLRARDLDIAKASAMFLKYLNWRRTFVPNGTISVTEIPNELAHNKIFLQGLDKKGRPVIIFICRRHIQTKGGLDKLKRFIVYFLDKTCARLPPGQEKFLFILDLEGWGQRNNDFHATQGAVAILQDYYPERLERLFVIHVPFICMTGWKLISPFIDSRTKQKIVFVENKRLKSTLLEEIDESQLLEIYGGKLPLVPFMEGSYH